MLDIAVCDDDRYLQGELEGMLYALGRKLRVGLEVYVYERGEFLLAEVQKGTQYDIVYLDIEMEGMDGIRVAEELRNRDRTMQLIYVTQHDRYLWRSIGTMPSGYIMKPVKPEEFEKVFRKICGWIQEKDDYFCFVSDKIKRKVPLRGIHYFWSALRQVEVVCGKESYLVYRKLDQIEGELEAAGQRQFLRIHQSYLVNYNQIRCFGHNWVELESGLRLPMSRRKREAVEERLGGEQMWE